MSTQSPNLLSTEALRIAVPGRELVTALNVAFRGGEFIAVLGRNGAGKTLSLSTLAGIRAADGGRAILGDRDIASQKRSDIALQLALLPQSVDDVFPGTVLDTAMTGRHPHIGRLRWESEEDRQITLAALKSVEVDALAARDILTLSGGERRRVAVAQILAQAPQLYLLDEPTNHLDPQHQLDVLKVFREKADAGCCVVASLHDVNLAARYADRCLLLYGDGRWEIGDTEFILSEERLASLYGTPMESVAWRNRRLFVAAGI
jgi:iron complex transport system ATP-binding protein